MINKMKIKRQVRILLEKMVAKYGYVLIKENEQNENCKGEEKLENAYEIKYSLVSDETKIPFDVDAYRKRANDEITLSWVIPPLGPGSGGHLNIFRVICILGDLGIKNRVYLYGGNEGIPSEDLRHTVKEYYGISLGKNEIYSNVRMMEYTDAVIATSWITAYVVNNFDNAISKFYFVQDFEPYFYARGSEYCFAENTYKFGFRGVTAGKWLAEKLSREYGMETQDFSFSYDRRLYCEKKKQDNVKRVFFYARPYTERRAYELGILALEKLAKKVPDLEVVFAGQKLINYQFGFRCIDKGIMSVEQLGDMYSQCDLCLVLSMTNLSLLPMEVMASNSVIVCNKGENNAWLCDENNSVMVESDPFDIADKMEYYLTHQEALEEKRKQGLAYVQRFTWENEIKKVYDFIEKSVLDDLKKMELEQENTK